MNKLDMIARRLALGQAGAPAKPAPARQPAKLANVVAALANASTKLPPPPTPTPAPARPKPQLTSIAVQRNADGRIAAVSVATASGSRHHLVAQRDAFGRMSAVVIDDRTTWKVQRGYYGQIAGLTPMEHDK